MVWSSDSPPFSVTDPRSLSFLSIDRPQESQPGAILQDISGPLPTNSWCENLFIGQSNTRSSNSVFQIPYIVDTSMIEEVPGLRVHGAFVQAEDKAVRMSFEEENALTMSSCEELDEQHVVKPYPATTRLAIVLKWFMKGQKNHLEAMKTHLVRGAPYITMEYYRATPLITARRAIASGYDVVVDKYSNTPQVLTCGDKRNAQVNDGIVAEKELELVFDQSDTTWIVFVSQPTRFICNSVEATKPTEELPPGVLPEHPERYQAYFELKATSPAAGTCCCNRYKQ